MIYAEIMNYSDYSRGWRCVETKFTVTWNMFLEFLITIEGPSDTPYAGGIFYLKGLYRRYYPTSPP